jgi:hypothetical protein
MPLTTTQKQTIAAYIAANPEWAALPKNSDTAFFFAQELNKEDPSSFVVWRTSVAQDEITQNGFDWVQVDNLTAGKARIWDWLFDNSSKTINPSKVNVRAGIAECWKGTAALLAVQAVVLGHCKRNATVVEKLLATGTGTTLSPANLTLESPISYQDIESVF